MTEYTTLDNRCSFFKLSHMMTHMYVKPCTAYKYQGFKFGNIHMQINFEKLDLAGNRFFVISFCGDEKVYQDPFALFKVVELDENMTNLIFLAYDTIGGDVVKKHYDTWCNELVKYLILYHHCTLHPKDLEAKEKLLNNHIIEDPLDAKSQDSDLVNLLKSEAERYYTARINGRDNNTFIDWDGFQKTL